jgi:hypothetical protein
VTSSRALLSFIYSWVCEIIREVGLTFVCEICEIGVDEPGINELGVNELGAA